MGHQSESNGTPKKTLGNLREKFSEPEISATTFVATPRDLWQPSIEPVPCPTCHGGFFWRSVYGDELRCADCSPWPSTALRRDLWLIVVEDDGSYGWELVR